MTDAYVIRDDYDQTTVAVVIGAADANEALQLANDHAVTGEGELYAVGPIHVIEKIGGSK